MIPWTIARYLADTSNCSHVRNLDQDILSQRFSSAGLKCCCSASFTFSEVLLE